jgi:hypothetical protein
MVQFTVNFVPFIFSASLGFAFQLCIFLPDVVEALSCLKSLSHRERNQSVNKLLIIGLGRVGLEVADLAIESEVVQVFGTVRQSLLQKDKIEGYYSDHSSSSRNNELFRIPFDPAAVREHLFGCDDDHETDEYSTTAASHVLFSIPLSREGDPLMKAVLNELIEWWNMEEVKNDNETENTSTNHCHSKVLGILSTTGVYGNHDGKVVTEYSARLCEETSNAELYRKFENDWMSLCDVMKEDNEILNKCDDTHHRRRLCIFRCAGIYDSSRSALHTIYNNLASSALPSSLRLPSSSLPSTGNKTNRIHSIDLARGVFSGMFQEIKKKDELKYSEVRIYNLADNLPESRSVVLSYAQELLASTGIDQRKFEEDTIGVTTTNKNPAASGKTLSRSSMRRQKRRERESKLVCNKRMREELFKGDDLKFPTYREGLYAIFNDPTTPWQQRQQ